LKRGVDGRAIALFGTDMITLTLKGKKSDDIKTTTWSLAKAPRCKRPACCSRRC
jgi:hypothetical protein